VSVKIRSRIVTVTGPRGELTKDLKHLSVSFVQSPLPNVINISLHHGTRKNVAALRTVKSLIANMVIGVTKGYKYKMRYVYAHFPINVNIDEDKETGLGHVEIRWVSCLDILKRQKRRVEAWE
jgi:large subunit ribosomal protein L9e